MSMSGFVLDSIPISGASTQDLAGENPVLRWFRAHEWAGFTAFAAVCFLLAAAKPAVGEMVSRRVHALLWGALASSC